MFTNVVICTHSSSSRKWLLHSTWIRNGQESLCKYFTRRRKVSRLRSIFPTRWKDFHPTHITRISNWFYVSNTKSMLFQLYNHHWRNKSLESAPTCRGISTSGDQGPNNHIVNCETIFQMQAKVISLETCTMSNDYPMKKLGSNTIHLTIPTTFHLLHLPVHK